MDARRATGNFTERLVFFLNMDVKEEHISPITTTRGNKPRKRWFILFVVLALASIMAIFFYPRPVETKFAWITPQQFQKENETGKLTLLKYKFLRAIGPMARIFHRKNKPNITIETCFWQAPASFMTEIDLGAPFSTNTDGRQAWLITPENINVFNERARKVPGAKMAARLTITTGNKGRASISSGSYGLSLFPTIRRDAVEILGLATELAPASTNRQGFSSAQGTLIFTCKALVPDGGALLIDSSGTNEQHYWTLISPVLIDATGKRIKK